MWFIGGENRKSARLGFVEPVVFFIVRVRLAGSRGVFGNGAGVVIVEFKCMDMQAFVINPGYWQGV